MSDKPLIGSHTFLSDYENCPRKAHRRHVVRDLPYVPSPQMLWGNVVHEAAEGRLTSGRPWPDDCAHLEPIALAILAAGRVYGEQKVAVTSQWRPCSFYDPDVYLRGKVDVVIEVNKWQALILDWKTGKERENPDELELHAALLWAREPHFQEIKGHYIWVNDQRLGHRHDLSAFAKTQLRVNRMMTHAQHAQRTDFWPPRENPLCRWCDVKDCEFNKQGK